MRSTSIALFVLAVLRPYLVAAESSSGISFEELAARHNAQIFTRQVPPPGPGDIVAPEDLDDYIILDEDDEFFANDTNFPNEYYDDEDEIIDTRLVPKSLVDDEEMSNELQERDDEDDGLPSPNIEMCNM
ncbi:hypothetical protein BDW02DRAFT_98880 [Decorospora gaudefroyi]|uniref:Uncharacterized protein n=1 Tax=Decorospora gaudefroyi TaxID=184978 RepID=A0A6A5K334_9PLEO|nr:hypothetical protein BDW02DRAFT_98880 [Decorospora gaudefroyi]